MNGLQNGVVGLVLGLLAAGTLAQAGGQDKPPAGGKPPAAKSASGEQGKSVPADASKGAPAGSTSMTGGDIAFIDIEAVIKDYQKTKDLQQQIRSERDAAKARVDDQAKELQKKSEEADLLSKGSQKWRQLDHDLKLGAVEMKYQAEQINNEADDKVCKAYRDIYGDINGVIDDLAKKRGLAAVFVKSSAEIDGKSEPEIIQKILLRQVLFNRGSLDLTKDVIETLNTHYKPNSPMPPDAARDVKK